MPPQAPWTIDAYETEQGEKPVKTFIEGLEGRNKVEAIALVKLLEEKGERSSATAVGSPWGGTLRAEGQGGPDLLHVSPEPGGHAPGRGDQEAGRHPREDARAGAGLPEGGCTPQAGGKETGEGAVKRKTAFMEWIDGQLEADPRLARKVDDLVNKMKLEQELTRLREKRGLSQRQLAKLLGTSQPYVAKIESGRIKNLGVNTLVKYARALGGSVTIKIEPDKRAVAARSARLRKAG